MSTNIARTRLGAIALGAALLAPSSAWSQDAQLRLGLDSLEPAGSACRVTLVAENALGGALTKAAFEFVFFDKDGRVELLTVLDLKDLPERRMRVRQFDLPNLDCAGVSRVLINDAKACEGPGIDAGACLAGLVTTSKAAIPLES